MLFDEDAQTVATCWSSDGPGSDTGPDEESGDSGDGDESQSDPGGDSDVQPDPARH